MLKDRTMISYIINCKHASGVLIIKEVQVYLNLCDIVFIILVLT